MRQYRREHGAVGIRRDAVCRRRCRHLDAANPTDLRLVLRGVDTEDFDTLAPAVIDDIKVVLRVADCPQTQDLRVEQRRIRRRRAEFETPAVECELRGAPAIPAARRAGARIDELESGAIAESAEHEPARVRNAREIFRALRAANEAMAVVRLASVTRHSGATCTQDQGGDESGVRCHARGSVRTGTCVSSSRRASTY